MDIDKTRQTIAEIQGILGEMQKLLKEVKKAKIESGTQYSGLDESSFNYTNAQKQALKNKYTMLKSIVKNLFITLP